MKGLVSATISTQAEEAKPTLENLLRHVNKYGLDAQHKGNNVGKPVRYSTYKQLRNDAAVEVARAYLGEDAYAMFVETVGAKAWTDEARKDWAAVREETDG